MEDTMTDDEFKKKLTPEQYHIMREKGTEMAFSGKYTEFDEDGIYVCAACGNPEALPNHVKFQEDYSYGFERTEVLCARCDSHLGHVFEDGPTRSGERFCINSLALDFEPQEK